MKKLFIITMALAVCLCFVENCLAQTFEECDDPGCGGEPNPGTFQHGENWGLGGLRAHDWSVPRCPGPEYSCIKLGHKKYQITGGPIGKYKDPCDSENPVPGCTEEYDIPIEYGPIPIDWRKIHEAIYTEILSDGSQEVWFLDVSTRTWYNDDDVSGIHALKYGGHLWFRYKIKNGLDKNNEQKWLYTDWAWTTVNWLTNEEVHINHLAQNGRIRDVDGWRTDVVMRSYGPHLMAIDPYIDRNPDLPDYHSFMATTDTIVMSPSENNVGIIKRLRSTGIGNDYEPMVSLVGYVVILHENGGGLGAAPLEGAMSSIEITHCTIGENDGWYSGIAIGNNGEDTYMTKRGSPDQMMFIPKGRYLEVFSGKEDNYVGIWDVANGGKIAATMIFFNTPDPTFIPNFSMVSCGVRSEKIGETGIYLPEYHPNMTNYGRAYLINGIRTVEEVKPGYFGPENLIMMAGYFDNEKMTAAGH